VDEVERIMKPNSRTTTLRRWLANKIAPGPGAGEAWCVNCPTTGRTVVMNADSMATHAATHPDDALVTMEAAWPHRRRPNVEDL
jgi:hypothetical protein